MAYVILLHKLQHLHIISLTSNSLTCSISRPRSSKDIIDWRNHQYRHKESNSTKKSTKPTQAIKKQILYIFSFKLEIKLYQIERNQTNISHYSFLYNTKGNNCWSIEHVNISSSNGDLAVVKMTFMLVTLTLTGLLTAPE